MTILVTGATGNVGRHLVDQLTRAGQRVRALTRDPARADLPAGVEVVAGDLAAPHTLASALDGATGLHLLAAGGDDYATLATGPDILKLAEQAGVRRVTVLWNGKEGPTEQAVTASGLAWTRLYPVEFMSNALTWVESIKDEGVVREPYGTSLSAVIHEADIAAVAAAALTQDGHAGKTYTLTGPEALTIPQRVRAIGAAIGRELRYVELTEDEAVRRWREAGLSEEVVEMFREWYGNPPPVAYTVLPTVEHVTGRAPRTFAQWVAEHADAFR